jgi:hypothetical protein
MKIMRPRNAGLNEVAVWNTNDSPQRAESVTLSMFSLHSIKIVDNGSSDLVGNHIVRGLYENQWFDAISLARR